MNPKLGTIEALHYDNPYWGIMNRKPFFGVHLALKGCGPEQNFLGARVSGLGFWKFILEN